MWFKSAETGHIAKFTFRTCKQKPNCSVDNYVTELYGLAPLAYPKGSVETIKQAILEQLLNDLVNLKHNVEMF